MNPVSPPVKSVILKIIKSRYLWANSNSSFDTHQVLVQDLRRKYVIMTVVQFCFHVAQLIKDSKID